MKVFFSHWLSNILLCPTIPFPYLTVKVPWYGFARNTTGVYKKSDSLLFSHQRSVEGQANEFTNPAPYLCPPFDHACKGGTTKRPGSSLVGGNSNDALSTDSVFDGRTPDSLQFRTEVYASVETRQGRVLGKEVYSTLDGGSREPYYAFLGLPYAEPPVGDLRFKVSIPKQ